MKNFVIIWCITVSCLCMNACKNPAVTQQDQNDFLKRYINKFHPENLCDTLSHISDLREVFDSKDTALDLSESDKEFMKQQLITYNGIRVLDKKVFKNTQWKTRDSKSLTELSVPIFSKNKTIAVIYKWYWCGNLCAEGGLWVFKYKNGHWEQLNLQLMRIVS